VSAQVVDIDDYREIWTSEIILYLCCGEIRIATYYVWSETLECPKCGTMTKFKILEDFPDEP
jgi:hypothetical protein